ncbi:unnamed protein product [Phytomonas sp. EM1]|nr:unnamed protein product [Phytomonas sp. EM1]|eukprot:CCW64090.1 unnamed protein product [Phytomonas sp. isolate EM1]
MASTTDGVEHCSLASSQDAQNLLSSFERNLHVAWEVGKRHFPPEERQTHDPVILQCIEKLILALQTTLKDTTDVPTACRQLQRFFEDEGFPQEENGELSNFLFEYRQSRELNGYSYHLRSSMHLPLLPRYEGDKKLEEEHIRPRVGYIVVLPSPHPNPNVNTSVQLIEPRKKRAPLDEYRIFSHPKKASTYGVEDFLVDEELTYRAIIVLRYHLDTFGSLVGLSPYARFLLWNFLGCDDEAFERIHNRPATTPEVQAELANLHRTIVIKQRIFEQTRTAAREAALHIGWCAISAQWRDQILHSLSEVSEGNWYSLGEIPRQGGRVLFPNFSGNALVCELAMGILARMAAVYGRAAPRKGAPSTAVAQHAVRAALLPFLKGVAPPPASDDELASSLLGRGLGGGNEAACHAWRRLQRVLAAHPTEGKASEDSSSVGCAHRRYAFICSSMLFPLQCLAELLDLCSLAYFAKDGIAAFSRSLLSAPWTCEEDLIRFLIQTEAMNPGIAPIVALPRLYRSMVSGIQKMLQDKLLLYVLAVRLKVENCATVRLNRKDYSYWKALTSMSSEDGEDYSDSFLLLEVEALESAPPLETLAAHRYYTEAFLERPPRVWDEDLEDFMKEEELYKRMHLVESNNNE